MRNQRLRGVALFTASLLLAGLMGLLAPAAVAAPTFTNTLGFATKTGFRGVFSWQASEPVKAEVHYGTNPGNLDQITAAIPGAPDSAGIAIAEGLTIGETYYWKVVDILSGQESEIESFEATNAYTSWDGSTYTLDLLVQLDSESLPPDVPHDLALKNVAAGINVFAERLYDAMDGYARLGNVLITDTNLDFGANVPFLPADCVAGESNAADVLIQTTVPFDSHTFGGWSIDNPCISFYVGRLGQLIVPWGLGGAPEDLHFGYVATHEMMHYAFNSPDLYNPADVNNPRIAGCWNLEWDGSLMHNSGGWVGNKWELTELDRNQQTTPCDHQHSGVWTWDMLRTRYTQVPPADPDGPVGSEIDHIIDTVARGNEDGGALNIEILDREPGLSTLENYTPQDDTLLTNPCTEPGRTLVLDVQGDSLDRVPEHDVLYSAIAEPNELEGKVVFTLQMASLANLPPDTVWPIIFRDPAGQDRFVRMSTDPLAQASFAHSTGTAVSPFSTPGTPADPSSSYTPEGTIRIVVDREAIGAAPGQKISDFLTRITIAAPPNPQTSGLTPDNMPDSLVRAGSYTIVGSENCMGSPPEAVDDLVAIDEDQSTSIDVLANDFDADGNALTITNVSKPSHGTAVVKDGQIFYTPVGNFNGEDSFSYSISDGLGGSDDAVVSVLIHPVADSPQAFDDRATVTSGEKLRIPVLANDRDPDGDPLSITSVSAPLHGSQQLNSDGTVLYTPDAGFAGTDVFQYTVSDGALTDTATVTIDVLLIGSADPCTVPGLTVATDPAGDQIPGHTGAFDVQSVHFAGLTPEGMLFVTLKVDGGMNPPPPSAAWQTRWTSGGFTYFVGLETDALGRAEFNYGTISGSTLSPLGAPDSASFSEDGFVTIGLSAATLGNPSPGDTFTGIIGQARRFIGASGLGGGYLNVDASPSPGGSFQVAGCIARLPNGAPNAIADSATTDEDVAVTIDVLANDSDPDGDDLTLGEFSQGTHGSVALNEDGGFSYTPNPNFNGNDSFMYTVSDGEYTASAAVDILVSPTNDPPIAFDDSAETEEDSSVSIDVLTNDTDVDGDQLSIESTSIAEHGEVTLQDDGSVVYTPEPNFFGADSFSYTVADGNGGLDDAVVSISVTAVNDAPVATDDSASARKNKSVTITVLENDSDVDGDPLQVASMTQPARGTVELASDGRITYTPQKGFSGTDSFTYEAGDGHLTDRATVTISVSNR